MNAKNFMLALTQVEDSFLSEAADEENIRSLFADFKAEADDETAENADYNSGGELYPKKKGKKVTLWKLMLVACIFVSMAIYGVLTVKTRGSFGYEYYREKVEAMFREARPDSEQAYSDIGNIIKYRTLEEFCDKHGTDCYYPAVLPEGIKIGYVAVQKGSIDLMGNFNEDDTLTYYLLQNADGSSGRYSFIFRAGENQPAPFKEYENVTREIINGVDCYILDSTGEFHQAHFVYNGDVYTVTAPTHKELMLLLDGMEKLELNDELF